MKEREEFSRDDAEIAELLRNVGAREEPSPQVMQEVEISVREEWLAVVASRRRRRLTVVWAAAASICALGVGAGISLQLMNDEGQPVATLQRLDGSIFVTADDSHWTRMSVGHRIAIGDSIRSDARAAFILDGGVAVRIDRGSTLKVIDEDRLTLNVGALYVESGQSNDVDSLTISTHAGSVRHIGTQYQVRTLINGIDVSVREGRVMIDSQAGSNVAVAGEQLTISTRGAVMRAKISSSDGQWQWASEVAPAFVIENTSLANFLVWVARETGRTLVYKSARAKSVAANEMLHGSIEGLAPNVALTAVLASTPLRQHEAKPDVIEIGFASSIDPLPRRPTP
jgi:ferric-dicitrate binding protein FerR (iron transport regulator)